MIGTIPLYGMLPPYHSYEGCFVPLFFAHVVSSFTSMTQYAIAADAPNSAAPAFLRWCRIAGNSDEVESVCCSDDLSLACHVGPETFSSFSDTDNDVTLDLTSLSFS